MDNTEISSEETESIEPLETSPEETHMIEIEAELAQVKELLTTETDQRLRAYAELENFRKRKEQETDSAKKYASEKVIIGLLPVLDSLILACTHATNHAPSPEKLKEGFVLIQKQFESALEKLGVQKIEAVGEIFDPNCHQAVSKEAADGVSSEIVLRDMQTGYRLHDRVIRPSMVVIAE